MSRVLANLLGELPEQFSHTVEYLDDLSGHEAVDVRLSLDVEQRAGHRLQQLGLDHTDSTAEEVYQGLLARFTDDEQRFMRAIGGHRHDGHTKILPRLIECLDRLAMPRDCWALKTVVARDCLKHCPPKKLMRHLKYRSLDSLLRREDPAAIVAAAAFIESPRWRTEWVRIIKQLEASDFEPRRAKILPMPAKTYENLPSRGALVGYIPQLGTVVVWPADVRAHALGLAVLILQALEAVRLNSAWLKFNQVRPGFGRRAAETFQSGYISTGSIAGLDLGWDDLARSVSQSNHWPSVFDHRLQPEDLATVSPAKLLAVIEPNLAAWAETDWVGIYKDGQSISFNLADVAVNAASDLALTQASVVWFQQNLKAELIHRYMEHGRVADEIWQQLEGGGVLAVTKVKR